MLPCIKGSPGIPEVLEGREHPPSLKSQQSQRVRLKLFRNQDPERDGRNRETVCGFITHMSAPLTSLLGLMRKCWPPGPKTEVTGSSDIFRLFKLDVV